MSPFIEYVQCLLTIRVLQARPGNVAALFLWDKQGKKKCALCGSSSHHLTHDLKNIKSYGSVPNTNVKGFF